MLLDELTEQHGGHRPREQGEGDNLVAMSAAAAGAVVSAVALDRALAAEDWPDGLRLAMRIGIHTGDVVWDEDVAHVTALLADHRLVTLTGAGGSGKTRVAQHVASEALPFAFDGAWWVDRFSSSVRRSLRAWPAPTTGGGCCTHG